MYRDYSPYSIFPANHMRVAAGVGVAVKASGTATDKAIVAEAAT